MPVTLNYLISYSASFDKTGGVCLYYLSAHSYSYDCFGFLLDHPESYLQSPY